MLRREQWNGPAGGLVFRAESPPSPGSSRCGPESEERSARHRPGRTSEPGCNRSSPVCNPRPGPGPRPRREAVRTADGSPEAPSREPTRGPGWVTSRAPDRPAGTPAATSRRTGVERRRVMPGSDVRLDDDGELDRSRPARGIASPRNGVEGARSVSPLLRGRRSRGDSQYVQVTRCRRRRTRMSRGDRPRRHPRPTCRGAARRPRPSDPSQSPKHTPRRRHPRHDRLPRLRRAVKVVPDATRPGAPRSASPSGYPSPPEPDQRPRRFRATREATKLGIAMTPHPPGVAGRSRRLG